MKNELIEDTKSFIDDRRTEIIADEIEDFEAEDLIQKEDMVITLTHKGFIKRMSTGKYKSQSKGGIGVSSGSIRDDDFLEHMFIASTHDYLVFFSNKGLAYRLKVHEIPQLEKTARGQTIRMLIGINENEKINAVIDVKNFDDEDCCFFIATKKGVVKKAPLNEFVRIQQSGKRAIKLDDDDEVIDVKVTDGKKEIILATRLGKALRIKEEVVRPMGRNARGVTGIKLQKDDQLCGLCIVDENSMMLMITEFGFGKRLDFENYMPHGRGTGGQRYYKHSDKKGQVAAVVQVNKDDDIMVISSKGMAIKIPSEQISQQGKNASGIKLVRVGSSDDYIVAISCVPKKA